MTEDNVYSEEYLGKLLSLAGKLYFAQVDITDIMAAEIYDVSSVRSLSEGITGYEVKTNNTYGLVTKLSYGSLYIDVDTDSHSVLSLNGEEDTPREYMMSTGMISSLYESTVWEEITGEESVSTISILAKASEEDIDILLISGANLDTEIEKLNTDEATKQEVINAVNSGKVVTIPAENITMGDWHGTGYIATNPETGAGTYMISGGLNGGSVDITVYRDYIIGIISEVYLMWTMIEVIAMLLTCAWVPGLDLILAGSVLMLIILFDRYVEYILMCARYLETGDEKLGKEIKERAWTDAISALFTSILRYFMVYLAGWYIGEDAIVDGEIIDGEITGGETGEVTGGETSGGETGGITGGESSAGIQGESRTVDDLIEGLPETTNSKGITRNYESSGGYEQTIKDFNSLNPSDVKNIDTKYGDGKVGKLKDGSTIVARPGSNTGGATLEIRISRNKVIKIRY